MNKSELISALSLYRVLGVMGPFVVNYKSAKGSWLGSFNDTLLWDKWTDYRNTGDEKEISKRDLIRLRRIALDGEKIKQYQ